MAKYKYEPIKKTLNLDVSNEAQIRAAEINASAITSRLQGKTLEEQANILYSAVQDLGNRENNAIVDVLAKNMRDNGILPEEINDILRQGKAAYEASKEQPRSKIEKGFGKIKTVEESRNQAAAEIRGRLDQVEPLSTLTGALTKVNSPELQATVVLNQDQSLLKKGVISKPQPGEEGFTYQRVELSHQFEGDLLTAYIKVNPLGYARDLLSGKNTEDQANILYSAQIKRDTAVVNALVKHLTNEGVFSPKQIENIKSAANLEISRIKLEEEITVAERERSPISIGKAPSSKTEVLKKVESRQLESSEELVRGRTSDPEVLRVELTPEELRKQVIIAREEEEIVEAVEKTRPRSNALTGRDDPRAPKVEEIEAQDSIILGSTTEKGPSKVTTLSSSEVDPITEAIRKEILAEQQKLIQTQIALSVPAVKDMDPQQFRKYLTSDPGKEEAAKVFAKPEIQTALNKIEVEGYRKVHTEFSESFKNVKWTPDQITAPDQPKTKTSEITNENDEVVAKIKETTHDIAPLAVTLDNGDKVNVKSYRTIDFPKELETGKGPLHLSMAVKDQNGRNISEKDAVYFTAHYDEQGKLTEVSSPIPVKFMGKGDDAVGYIERVGPDGKPKVYTLPVTQGKYKEMMREVAKNKGMAVDLSQEVAQEAQDLALTKEKAKVSPALEKDEEVQPKQKTEKSQSEDSLALPKPEPLPLEIVSTYGLTGTEKSRAIDNMLKGASSDQIVATLKDQVAKGGSEAVELIVEATKSDRLGDHPNVPTLTAKQFQEVYETGMKAAKSIAESPPNSSNSKVQKLKMENILSACTKLASPAGIEDAAHKQARTASRVSFGQNNPPQIGR